ncbi:MAG: cysteine-rich CWC family protein [Lutibacter sp.]
MCSHEEKYCSSCNDVFECKVGSILICQCTTITLNEKERDYMPEKYDDCLCASCMREVRAEYHNNKLKSKIKKLLGIFE